MVIDIDDDLADEVRQLQAVPAPDFIDAVKDHWTNATPLFEFVGQAVNCDPTDVSCGCLTMIRNSKGRYAAFTPRGVIDRELTEMIDADTRLPDVIDDVTKEHLLIFAEWQMRIRARYATLKS